MAQDSRTFKNPTTGTTWVLPRDLGRFLAIHGRMVDPPGCEGGHYGCSIWEGGPCMAEWAPVDDDDTEEV